MSIYVRTSNLKKIADRATVQVQSFELWFSNVSKYPPPNHEKVCCQTNNHHSHVVTFISVLEISDTMILYGRNYLPTSVWLIRLSRAGVISLKDVDNVIHSVQYNASALLCCLCGNDVSLELQIFSCCDKRTKCLTKTMWDHSHDFTITWIGNFRHQFYIIINMHHQLCFQDLNLYFHPVSVCVSVWYGSYLLIHIESITPLKVFSPNF